MKILRIKGATLVVLETNDEEYYLEQICTGFKADVEADTSDPETPDPPEMEEFAHDLGGQLDYHKFESKSKS